MFTTYRACKVGCRGLRPISAGGLGVYGSGGQCAGRETVTTVHILSTLVPILIVLAVLAACCAAV